MEYRINKNKSLLKRLSRLGYPLFESEEALDVNVTLADVVKSKDLRLWEGFPVLLANSAEKGSICLSQRCKIKSLSLPVENPAGFTGFKSSR